MKNFNYDGQYPGYIDGEWIVDEQDGHVWLNLPSTSTLESFPEDIIIHFMENPKEYGNPNITFSDEVFEIRGFKFDNILKRNKKQTNIRDYAEVIIGHDLSTNIPDHIPPGVTIGSIILSNEQSGKIINVINLRNVLVLDLVRKVKFHFGVAVRVAEYGLVSFNNVSVDNTRSISFDSFFVEAPIENYLEGKTTYSSPEDYQNFLSTLTNSSDWFTRYSEMPKYDSTALIGPNVIKKPGPQGLTIMNLEGAFELVRGFTGIKSILMPYCPGVALAIRFTNFHDHGTDTPYLNLLTEKFIKFNFLTRMLEPSR